MMKVVGLIGALLSSVVSAYAAGTGEIGSGVGSIAQCRRQVERALMRHLANNVSPEEIKRVEVRESVLVNKSAKDLNGAARETYHLIWGYATGEMSFERYSVEIVSDVVAVVPASGGGIKCSIRKIELSDIVE